MGVFLISCLFFDVLKVGQRLVEVVSVYFVLRWRWPLAVLDVKLWLWHLRWMQSNGALDGTESILFKNKVQLKFILRIQISSIQPVEAFSLFILCWWLGKSDLRCVVSLTLFTEDGNFFIAAAIPTCKSISDESYDIIAWLF